MEAKPQKVEWGHTSTLGVLLTIFGALGGIVAAIKSNDTATITAGVVAVLTGVSTLGGRFAQAVAAIRQAAQGYGPTLQAVLDALDSPDREVEVLDAPEPFSDPADDPAGAETAERIAPEDRR